MCGVDEKVHPTALLETVARDSSGDSGNILIIELFPVPVSPKRRTFGMVERDEVLCSGKVVWSGMTSAVSGRDAVGIKSGRVERWCSVTRGVSLGLHMDLDECGVLLDVCSEAEADAPFAPNPGAEFA